MAATVSDIMTTSVETISPDTTVAEAADRLAARAFGAFPVVDGAGRLIGLLRDEDLMVAQGSVHVPRMLYVLGAVVPLPGEMKHVEDELHKVAGSTVADVMDAEPVTIGPQESVNDVATLMHELGVTHVPVVDGDGKLLGIVARGDVVRFIAATT